MKSLSNRGSDPTQLSIQHRANNLQLDSDQRLHPGVLDCVNHTCQDIECLVVNPPMCTSCQIQIEAAEAASRMVVEVLFPMLLKPL